MLLHRAFLVLCSSWTQQASSDDELTSGVDGTCRIGVVAKSVFVASPSPTTSASRWQRRPSTLLASLLPLRRRRTARTPTRLSIVALLGLRLWLCIRMTCQPARAHACQASTRCPSRPLLKVSHLLGVQRNGAGGKRIRLASVISVPSQSLRFTQAAASSH